MFERYTERARRVIFYGRYEASHLGSMTIETEHLLLGLIREDKNLISRIFRNGSSIESLFQEIKVRVDFRKKVSTAIDLPLSNECKRALAYAAEESELLKDSHIGTEHLLLGILREESCLAATILHKRGIRLETLREELANSPTEPVNTATELPADFFVDSDAMVPDAETAKRIATAIWLPAYGGQTAGGAMVAEIVSFNIWRVVAGPLFAFVNATDGTVLAMGMSPMGNTGV